MPCADLRPRSRSPRAPGRCCRRTERNACEDIATTFRLLPRPLRRMVHRLTPRPEAVADVSLYRYALPLRTRISAAEKRTGVLMRLVGKDDFVGDRKSTRLNSSHVAISYAVFCLKKKNN